jgi:hypothetical protein
MKISVLLCDHWAIKHPQTFWYNFYYRTQVLGSGLYFVGLKMFAMRDLIIQMYGETAESQCTMKTMFSLSVVRVFTLALSTCG